MNDSDSAFSGIHRVAAMLESDGLAALSAVANIVGSHVAVAMAVMFLRQHGFQGRDCAAINKEVLDALPSAPTAAPSYERLTRRELEVLKLIAEGNSNKEAARTLGVSSRTIEFHRVKVKEKLHTTGNASDLLRILSLYQLAGTDLTVSPPAS